MTLKVSWLNTTDEEMNTSVLLNENDLEMLAPAIDTLYEKAGILVDQYSDSRIYSDHSKIILDAVNAHNLKSSDAIETFKKMLEKSYLETKTLCTYGD